LLLRRGCYIMSDGRLFALPELPYA